jgi:hypothetical protein
MGSCYQIAMGAEINKKIKFGFKQQMRLRKMARASQAAEKVLLVIPSEARDLLFFSISKKQQIPRANPALRNDMAWVFPQPIQPEVVGPSEV